MPTLTLPNATLPLPQFSQLDAITLSEQICTSLQRCTTQLEHVPTPPYNVSNVLQFIEHVELCDTQLAEAWNILSHLHAVNNNDALRQAHETLLPQITAYYTAQGQHAELYACFAALQADAHFFAQLPTDRQASIQLAIRDFKLMGVNLPPAEKKQFADIEAKLAQLASEFSNHVLDATADYTYAVQEHELAGLPEYVLQLLAHNAQHVHSENAHLKYAATLDLPTYLGVMTFAAHRPLRERIYRAYAVRCSDYAEGTHANAYNNSTLIARTLQLRQQKATLLGFRHYADLSLTSKMAESPEEVLHFLNQLAETAKPYAQAELAALTSYAAQDGLTTLEAWDIPYYSERLKQAHYAISEAEYKPYFTLDRVIQGLFDLAQTLFGIEIKPAAFDSYVGDHAQYYEIYQEGQVIAGFIFDLFARSNKRGGAWMGSLRPKLHLAGQQQHPVAFMVCNFNPPTDNTPVQLTHQNIQTLFHEFGHGLHFLLTRVNVPSVAGTYGVAWDAVELPSQIMEFWIWDSDVLKSLSQHVQTGESLPDHLIARLEKARHFQAGLHMLRQLEFALVDMTLHMAAPPLDTPINTYLNHTLHTIRQRISVVFPPTYQQFLHAFSHIFAGGYAAGYYSYKWAEVLAADAFNRFDEEGLFNTRTGQDFCDHVLAVGGSVPAMQAFIHFRGRKPDMNALLQHSGMLTRNAS